MAQQTNIGVIGTSWWADMVFLPILQNYERANLVAICGRNRQRADEMAAKYAVPQVYTDYRQMIDAAKLDAIIVATPDDTHYELVMSVLDAGLHVLCEKPVALNADHALEMLNRAEAAAVKHMVMYTHHWWPNLQRTKQLLDQDYLGKVYHGNFYWLAGYARDPAYQWRFDANRANGILGDLGSHLIHMALWFLGDITAVTSRLGQHVQRDGANGEPPNPANDSAHFMLEFANGAIVQCFITAIAQGIDSAMKVSVELHGEKGSLEAAWFPLNAPMDMTLKGKQSSGDNHLSETSQIDIGNFLATNAVGARLFVNSILDNQRIAPGFSEGYKVQRIIDAAMQSHQSGCRVVIEP